MDRRRIQEEEGGSNSSTTTTTTTATTADGIKRAADCMAASLMIFGAAAQHSGSRVTPCPPCITAGGVGGGCTGRETDGDAAAKGKMRSATGVELMKVAQEELESAYANFATLNNRQGGGGGVGERREETGCLVGILDSLNSAETITGYLHRRNRVRSVITNVTPQVFAKVCSTCSRVEEYDNSDDGRSANGAGKETTEQSSSSSQQSSPSLYPPRRRRCHRRQFTIPSWVYSMPLPAYIIVVDDDERTRREFPFGQYGDEDDNDVVCGTSTAKEKEEADRDGGKEEEKGEERAKADPDVSSDGGEGEGTKRMTRAFHGSATHNWHSILHNGLRNRVGSDQQVTGTRGVFGDGIYLSTSLRVAEDFARFEPTLLDTGSVMPPRRLLSSRTRQGEKNGEEKGIGNLKNAKGFVIHPQQHVRIVGVFDVVLGKSTATAATDSKMPDTYLVVQNSGHTRLRYLLVYTTENSTAGAFLSPRVRKIVAMCFVVIFLCLFVFWKLTNQNSKNRKRRALWGR